MWLAVSNTHSSKQVKLRGDTFHYWSGVHGHMMSYIISFSRISKVNLKLILVKLYAQVGEGKLDLPKEETSGISSQHFLKLSETQLLYQNLVYLLGKNFLLSQQLFWIIFVSSLGFYPKIKEPQFSQYFGLAGLLHIFS